MYPCRMSTACWYQSRYHLFKFYFLTKVQTCSKQIMKKDDMSKIVLKAMLFAWDKGAMQRHTPTTNASVHAISHLPLLLLLSPCFPSSDHAWPHLYRFYTWSIPSYTPTQRPYPWRSTRNIPLSSLVHALLRTRISIPISCIAVWMALAKSRCQSTCGKRC